uniref:Uncharacterized protein n=1 Tax=Brassica oleracea var. oleracea TaxID=109376 RepID=A0A0D3BED1_BRAOL
MSTATSVGRDPLFLSSSDRAAAIKIRFADIIVKSSSNKSEAMMTIRREKLLLQLQEKASIEARMKVRQEERLAMLKMEEEEEARSNDKFEQDPLSAEKAEKELLKLIGGSHLRDDEHFFIDHPVAVPIRLLPVLRVLAMTTATSLGRDPLFLSSSSSSKSDRAAAIKIRFADIIVKSSSNKSEAMMTIRREKLLLQLQEKASIEARMKVRQEERLAIMKMEEEEEARSNCKFEQDPLSAKKTEKELLILIGGSRKARDRSLLKKFGLVLKTDPIDDDLLYDLEEGEIF